MATSMSTNNVRRVHMHGGIIGLFLGGSQRALQQGLASANSANEELVFVLPDVWSVSMNLLAVLILFCTLLLWCPAPGYLIITRRQG